MSIFRSQGTVRVEICLEETCPKYRLFFTPTSDYRIKHDGKSYAIFLNADGKNSISREYNEEQDSEIEISIPSKATKYLSPNTPFSLY